MEEHTIMSDSNKLPNINTEFISTIQNFFNEYKEKVLSLYDPENFHFNIPVDLKSTDIHYYINRLNQRMENESMAIEFYYGMPSSLWTPYGKIRLVKGDCWYANDGYDKKKELENFIKENFLTSELIPLTKNFDGEYGPVYQINKIGEKELEPVKIISDQYFLIDYEKGQNFVEELKKRFE